MVISVLPLFAIFISTKSHIFFTSSSDNLTRTLVADLDIALTIFVVSKFSLVPSFLIT